jgi:hypothetical protein
MSTWPFWRNFIPNWQNFLKQDGATSHTSERSLARVHEMFTAERTVRQGSWPPRSPDLSICDFYLWGYLKGRVQIGRASCRERVFLSV